MAGTLRPGDRVLVNRVVYRLRDPRRGDVIVFAYPRDTAVAFIKRVVGVPGDVLQVRGGRLYVNGRPLREPYVHRTQGTQDPTTAAAPVVGTTMTPPWSLDAAVSRPGRVLLRDGRQPHQQRRQPRLGRGPASRRDRRGVLHVLASRPTRPAVSDGVGA